MGLRDALKARVKAVLAGAPASRPAERTEGASGEAASRSQVVVAAAVVVPAPGAVPVSVAIPPSPVATAASPVATELRIVAPASAVREGKPGTYAHRGLNVAVFRHGGRLFAIDNACAHEDGPIGEGAIEGTCVRCPYHDWQYDFTTGACLTDPERNRATFAVVELEGSIWLGAMLTAGSESRGGDHDDGLEVIRQ